MLLLAGAESLADIGAACGFASRRQFSAILKRILGIGPKRFACFTSRRRSDCDLLLQRARGKSHRENASAAWRISHGQSAAVGFNTSARDG